MMQYVMKFMVSQYPLKFSYVLLYFAKLCYFPPFFPLTQLFQLILGEWGVSLICYSSKHHLQVYTYFHVRVHFSHISFPFNLIPSNHLDCKQFEFQTAFNNHSDFYTFIYPRHRTCTYSMQCPAVRTQHALISTPPQKCVFLFEVFICRDATQGCLPAVVLAPPQILLSGL